MRILALQVSTFRNLEDAVLEPSDRFNVLWGENGQGKTNLLEAIYLVATLRSFRTSSLQELVRSGSTEARVSARIERGGFERVYEVALHAGRREVSLDGKTPRHLGEYFGGFNVVLFAPEDLAVPRGSPGERRRFLDRSVFNRNARFLSDAQRYARVLRSRNLLLRQGLSASTTLLDVYDEQLVEIGEKVREARTAYLEEIRPRFQEAFGSISAGDLEADVTYRMRGHELAAELAATRETDLARGKTTVGPHSDDLDFRLQGRPARVFASQGQLRALVLAWKTAEMKLLLEALGDSPVLLLDDVSSELDARRNRALFDFLVTFEGQCFVTTTHERHVLASEERTDFQIVEGRARRPGAP